MSRSGHDALEREIASEGPLPDYDETCSEIQRLRRIAANCRNAGVVPPMGRSRSEIQKYRKDIKRLVTRQNGYIKKYRTRAEEAIATQGRLDRARVWHISQGTAESIQKNLGVLLQDPKNPDQAAEEAVKRLLNRNDL